MERAEEIIFNYLLCAAVRHLKIDLELFSRDRIFYGKHMYKVSLARLGM